MSTNTTNSDLESSSASATDDEQYDRVAPLCTCGHGSTSTTMLSSSPTSSVIGGGGTTRTNGLGIAGGNHQTSSSKKKPSSASASSSSWLESSFVHLVTPRRPRNTSGSNIGGRHYDDGDQQHQQVMHGFLEQHQHLLKLLDAAQGMVGGGTVGGDEDHPNGPAGSGGNDANDGGGLEMCVDCADRVAAALEADTHRLYAEAEAYRDAMTAAQIRSKSLQQQTAATFASSSAAGISSSSSSLLLSQQHDTPLSLAEHAYQQEIAMLEREVQAREEELENLKDVYREQTLLGQHLDEVDEQMEMEQNALELESQAFEHRRHLLSKTLTEVQLEMDKLTLVPLPRALFDLKVDPRGLRYPLINQLRLAFRPKGDVPTKEIQVAWSQATQLLLFLGTLLDYPGQDWKVVPLADCAKLIYRKEIFNLLPGDTRSLLAWNALLDQVVKYALTTVGGASGSRSTSGQPPKSRGIKGINTASASSSSMTSDPLTARIVTPPSPPFPSTPTSIGDTELARLDRMDHVGWSQVIHRMASNLLWLSDRASDRAAIQVSSMAHCGM